MLSLGKTGLLLLLLGTKFSKTGKSHEMLRITSWEVRCLTSPISPHHWPVPTASPAAPAARHRLGAGLLPASPLEGCAAGAAQPGAQSQDRLPGAQKLAARVSLSALQGWGQDFLGFKHLPSQIPSKIRDGPHKLPQCYRAVSW